MNPEIMALMSYVLPFLRQQQGDGFTPPGTGSVPSQGDLVTALQGNPALRGIAPNMVTGVGPRASTPLNPEFAMTLGGMGRGLMDRTGGSSGDYSGERPERFVRGQPQGMPPKIGNPQTDFQMTQMQNPAASIGQFLLSPAGQQIIKALQGIGA